MTSAASNPAHLRLVGTDETDDGLSPIPASDEVAVENTRAAGNAGLDPNDPRWVLAVRTYAQLQGTTLPHDRRHRLMRTAQQLGIRPFEANVIIAVVQDHARRGAQLGEAGGTLVLLDAPERSASRQVWLRLCAAFLCGALGSVWLIRWIVG